MKYGIGIIGCGRISQKHVDAVMRNADTCRLVALCDVVVDRAQTLLERNRSALGPEAGGACEIPYVCSDYRRVLEDRDVQIVTVATESGYHARIALDALHAGKHVLVEKPMALSLDDADAMIKLSSDSGLKLGVCHQNRFNPTVALLKKTVDEGRLGKLIYAAASIRWTRDDAYYLQAPWRGTWELDGGCLMNQCIHNIDLLAWILGDPRTVYAKTATFLKRIEGEDTGVAVIEFRSGAFAVVDGSVCVYPRNLEETLAIFGETGTVRIGGVALNLIDIWRVKDMSLQAESQEVGYEVDSVYGHGHALLLRDFVEAVSTGRQPLVDGREGRRALEVVLAMYKSSRTKRPVELPLGSYSTTTDLTR